jgi:hypothetical protein
MKKRGSLMFGISFLLLLSLALVTPRRTFAQDHLVAPSDLQKDAAAATADRQKNREQLDGFFSAPEAQRALNSAHIDSGQVRNAISELDDDDVAQLSARSEKAQKDFAAGTLSNRDLIIIILCIAALILIIVAVR